MDESVVKHLEQPITYTRLSEAMRAGSRLHPQGDAIWLGGKSCAIGAAYVAVFGPPQIDMMTDEAVNALSRVGLWPRNMEPHEIWRRNDAFGWTREKIADWLESQGY